MQPTTMWSRQRIATNDGRERTNGSPARQRPRDSVCAVSRLISAYDTIWGTSDYAPEMIHAAAKGHPYSCFVRPDPDPVNARRGGRSLTLAAAPRGRLTRTAYNVAAFNPRRPGRRHDAFPSAKIDWLADAKRQQIVIHGRRTSTTARAARPGFAPRLDFERAFWFT
jgi:hypothetical protein